MKDLSIFQKVMILIFSSMLVAVIVCAIYICNFINNANDTLASVDEVVLECKQKLDTLDINAINDTVTKSSQLLDNIDDVIIKADGLVGSMEEAMVKTNEMLTTVGEFTKSIAEVKGEVDNMKNTVNEISSGLTNVKNIFGR